MKARHAEENVNELADEPNASNEDDAKDL